MSLGVRHLYIFRVKHALRILLPITILLSACRHAATRAERERELLPVVLRYSYTHYFPGFERPSTKTVFVGIPSENWASKPEGQLLIQMFYHDPSPEWLTAFASSGISVLPASRVAFTNEEPWYHNPKTSERVIVFAVHGITFRDQDHASVLTSACMAPLGGGETIFQLARDHGKWRVTGSELGTIY